MGVMVLLGIVVSIVNIPMFTYMQTVVDEAKLGRVMSLLNFASVGLVPLSYSLCAFVLHNHVVTVRQLFFICGAAMALLMLSLSFFPAFRNMERHPRWRAATSKSHIELSGE